MYPRINRKCLAGGSRVLGALRCSLVKDSEPSHLSPPTSPLGSRLLTSFALAVLLGGCATSPKSSFKRPANLFPPEALITQRGVLTARGKQFTLNGYVSL